VHVEISHHVAVVDDTLTDDRRAGVLVTGSDHVTVTGNQLRDDGGGIVLGGVDRGAGSDGPRLLTAVSVSANRVTDSGTTGLHQALPKGQSVAFDHDTYRGERFEWQGRSVTFAQWQRDGQERHGTSRP
jgi:hypothetical protein